MSDEDRELTELPDLHDAALVELRVDWQAGRCTVVLNRVAEGGYEMCFEKLRELYVPRQCPWGPSAYVNHFRQTQSGEFEMEMQSGDVVRIAAETWTACLREIA